jgi:RND family efflux transporter MFP subunit
MTLSRPGRLGCRAVAVILSGGAVAFLLLTALRDPALAEQLVAEGGVIETVQVLLLATAGLLAARQGWVALKAGRPVALEVAIVGMMAGAVIGELDIDRALFGVKIISTRFFVNPRVSLPLRALAVAVVVGVPTALGVWLLRHRRELWRAGLAGLREPWGQVAASGAGLLVLAELFERRLNRVRGLPPNLAEEAVELVAAILIFVGLTARPRAIIDRMFPRALVLLTLITLGSFGCRGEHPASASQARPVSPEPPPRAVTVIPAAERTLARTVAATGTLAADEQIVLGTKVAGRLAEVTVDLGTRVQRGQVIGRLDPSDSQLRVEQAEAALQQARARLGLSPTGTDEHVNPDDTAIVRQARAVLEEARLTRERSTRLLEQQLIARAQLDTADANLKVAEGRYQDALEEVRNRQAVITQRRSERDLARQQLADTVIVSPSDGAVSAKQAAVGEYLAAGAPLATLVRVHPLRLRVPVPEREGAGVRAGQAVWLTVEGDPTVYRGRVVRLSPIVQEQSRTLLVEAQVPNERALLRPGSFARVEIVTDGGQPVVTVPASAVIVFAGVEKVIVVRQDRTAEVRVTTGRRLGDEVEVLDGLKRGEPVVASPGNLTGGQPVTVSR